LSSSPAPDLPREVNEIMIAFPVGVNIHFRGPRGTREAIRLISQMYSSHVLPQ
jgi:hypothetical protein